MVDSLQINSIKELEAVIEHFDKYPLHTVKFRNFLLFKQVFNIVKSKKHLTMEGLREIVSIKASLNLARLSDSLKEAFPNTVPFTPECNMLSGEIKILDPNWIVGFTSGGGCFWIGVYYKSTHRLGECVQLGIELTQHIQDEDLLRRFIDIFGCGRIKKTSARPDICEFSVESHADILEKVIPFF